MPTLNWIGKEQIINHHNDVPFRVLERKYTWNADGSSAQQHASRVHTTNKIIHGDNLEALKALLPEYEGRIKCIYIDPPYNTGNENWVYNDNVNSPKIRKWLGQVVGKESEDLSRHDKWLCMMYPRLVLLQKLLSNDGAIFISIDDNEQANLKLICDEIFGAGNFVANVSWQRTYSPRNDSKGISQETEHILVYSKTSEWQPGKLPRTAEMDSKYKNPDNDDNAWTSSDAFAPSAATHQGMVYAIQHPFTGKMIYPYKGACWPLQQDKMFEEISKWGNYEYRNLNDDEERANVCGIEKEQIRKNVLGIVLKDDIETARTKAQEIYNKGKWPKFYFTNKGKGGIRRKTYIDNVGGKNVTNFWPYTEVGHTDFAQKEIKSIFEQRVFDTPKPSILINRILQIASDKDSIILDSFAGSGTTAHAVLNLNKSDGGNRKFILVEMEDYAETITAERVRRVIKGYGDTEGTGGSFEFYELGEPVFNADGYLNENIGTEKLRDYIWYSETRVGLQAARLSIADEPSALQPQSQYLLGNLNGTAYYFYYEPDQITTLSHETLSIVIEEAETYVIYADQCAIDGEWLAAHNIIFKKIPRDIRKF